MKVKTADLIGPALDWAVAKCEGLDIKFPKLPFQSETRFVCRVGQADSTDFRAYKPTKSWTLAGPIIEREGIYLRANDTATEWAAGALRKNRLDKKPGPLFYAKTPLIAAMRCYVASKLGDEIEIPEELL